VLKKPRELHERSWKAGEHAGHHEHTRGVKTHAARPRKDLCHPDHICFIHTRITQCIQYSHANGAVKLSLAGGQCFTRGRRAVAVPMGAVGAFAPIPPPQPEAEPRTAVGLPGAGGGEQGRGAGPGGLR